jgi:predicted ester cyclase
MVTRGQGRYITQNDYFRSLSSVHRKEMAGFCHVRPATSVLPLKSSRMKTAIESEEMYMSTEENARTIRRIYDELWNRRKLAVADDVIAEGATNYDTGLLPMPFGPEEMKGTIRMVTASFPDNRHEVEEVIAEADTVVLRCTLTGTHEGPFMGIPPTGRRIEVTEIHIYRLKGGKAVEHRVGRDDLGAMRQLGVIADAIPEPGSPPRATAANTPE